MENKKWTPEWPTEPGWYWGFGKYKGSMQPTQLETFEVKKIGNGVMHISHGAFMYKSEWIGVFMPIPPPYPIHPTVQQIEEFEKRMDKLND